MRELIITVKFGAAERQELARYPWHMTPRVHESIRFTCQQDAWTYPDKQYPGGRNIKGEQLTATVSIVMLDMDNPDALRLGVVNICGPGGAILINPEPTEAP